MEMTERAMSPLLEVERPSSAQPAILTARQWQHEYYNPETARVNIGHLKPPLRK